MRISDWSSDVCSSDLAQRVGSSFERPFLCEGYLVHLSCRMGIAVGEAALENPDALLRRASAALADAKEQEPNSSQVYIGDAEVDALQKLATLESDLRRAMAEGEIVILFQPQVDIASGSIVGVEALTRWLRSEEHTSELQSLMRISYAVFCLKNK